MKLKLLLVALCLACASAFVQAQFDDKLTPAFREWHAANPWYGTDPERTKFAHEYAKQLQKERPGLIGRQLLDAVSRAVAQKFGPPK